MLLALALAVVAPSAVVVIMGECANDTGRRLEYTQDGLYAALAGGSFVDVEERGAQSDLHAGWATSAVASGMLKNFHAEVRADELNAAGGARMYSARVGYFAQWVRSGAGGFIIGYRDVRGAPDEWRLSGFELSLPFVGTIGSSRGWIRFGPTYRIGEEDLNAGWNFEVWGPVGPALVGMMLGREGMHSRDPFVFQLMVGSSHRRAD